MNEATCHVIAATDYITFVLFLLRYHVELVKLLACCTMGKNVYTEIKCHSLLPLDDIVAMVSHQDCIPEVHIVHMQLCWC